MLQSLCARVGRERRAGLVRVRRARWHRSAGGARAHGGRAFLAPAGRRGHPLPAREPSRRGAVAVRPSWSARDEIIIIYDK